MVSALRGANGQRDEWGFAKRPTDEQVESVMLLHLLLDRQIGGIADCVRKIVFRGEWDGYKQFIATELADLSVLVKRFCNVMELDYEEVERLGDERDAEKKASWEKRHPEGRWV